MNIKSILTPPKFEDEEEIRIANLLNTILLSLLFSGAIYSIVALTETPFQVARFLMIVSLMVLTSISYVFMLFRKLRFASILISISALIFTTGTVLLTGGVEAPMTGGFIITFLVAGILLGWRAGIVFAALSLLAWFGIYIIESNGYLPQSRIEHHTSVVWALKNLLFFIAAVILYLATKSISSALQLVRSERNSLEEKVNNRTIELKSANENLKKKKEELQEIAITDELTQLYNRRFFNDKLNDEFSRAKRHPRELACIICDIDHFKNFNDTYGHQTGDLVLQRVASVIKKQARVSDIVARYGGEEFVVLLPETGSSGSEVFAEKMRSAIEAEEFETAKGEKLSVTISVGVCVLAPEDLEQISDNSQIVKFADDALYEAKNNGRNRVEIYQN